HRTLPEAVPVDDARPVPEIEDMAGVQRPMDHARGADLPGPRAPQPPRPPPGRPAAREARDAQRADPGATPVHPAPPAPRAAAARPALRAWLAHRGGSRIARARLLPLLRPPRARGPGSREPARRRGSQPVPAAGDRREAGQSVSYARLYGASGDLSGSGTLRH